MNELLRAMREYSGELARNEEAGGSRFAKDARLFHAGERVREILGDSCQVEHEKIGNRTRITPNRYRAGNIAYRYRHHNRRYA